MVTEDTMARALAHREEAILRLAQGDAEESLVDFMGLLWPVLEPTRPMVRSKALDAVCEHLEAVTSGQIRKLLINVPPGFTKSLTTNVFWPAWEWIHDPTRRYVSASYADSLSIRDNRKFRLVVQSEVYRHLWGDLFSLSADQNEKRKIENTLTGFKLATSVGGVGTGERGDRFLVDDPHNVKEAESEAIRESALQWFAEVVPTRLNDADLSAIVVIMQRVHERDVSGLIISRELGYEHLCLPMEFESDRRCSNSIFTDWRTEDGELLCPQRFSRRYLEEDLKPAMRSWGGSYAEAGQLQQRPAPRGGGMFPKKHVRYVDRTEPGTTVRGWDLAAVKGPGAKYTVGVKMTRTPDGRIIVEDVIRFRGTPYEVKEAIKAAAVGDGLRTRTSIPQDPGQAGVAQKVDMISYLHGHDVRFSTETGEKEVRARPFAAQWEAGNVYLVRAPWNDPYLAEMGLFPAGEYSDQADGSSRAYFELAKDKGSQVSMHGPTLFMDGDSV